MQQRKKIYKRALKNISNGNDFWTCIAIGCQIKGEELPSKRAEKFPEFMLFKPNNLDTDRPWFDSQLEREICLDLCILFCNEKMFDNA
jgi:hypothetical protein